MPLENIVNWEIFIRNLLDKNRVKVFLTGSSAKMLSIELATSLRGRTISYLLHPFSLSEFLKIKEFNYNQYLSTNEKIQFMNLYRQYFNFGGYPFTIVTIVHWRAIKGALSASMH